MKNSRYLFRNSLLVRTFFVAIIVILSFSSATKVFANPESEHYKIDYLLNMIGSSDLVFIRNYTEYTGKEAQTHLREKMDYTGDSVHTAEDFINYIGSESSATGTPYYVRLANGTQIESGIWLRSKLAELK